jgi:EAL domain-containing protein (putative c-di-GMP-specific phosphodiesterase class I)
LLKTAAEQCLPSSAESVRHPNLGRRFRHRILVTRLSQSISDQLVENRQTVRKISAGRPARCSDCVGKIIGIAHSLNLNMVVEDVETENQHKRPNAAGCNCGQRFLFSVPMRSENISLTLRDRG